MSRQVCKRTRVFCVFNSALRKSCQLNFFEVMVNKNVKSDTAWTWLPTKAIIIYNGKTDWDPIADFKKKGYALFNGNTLPFECVMVNLANILDSDYRNSDNPSAAIGTLVMKHAYDPDGLRKAGEIIKELLNKLDNNTRGTLVKKIELYFQKPLRLSNEKASFPAAFGLKGF